MSDRALTLSKLRASWSSIEAVAASLDEAQWKVQSLCPAWTVQGVFVHVAAIEQILVGWKPGPDLPFGGLGAAAAELSALSPAELVERFRTIIATRNSEMDAMSDDEFNAPCATPVGPATYARFMAIRTFDVWVHERDMRVPLGIPGDDGGPAAELSLDEVHNSLGYIAGKKIGLPDGKSMAFDVTGPVTRRMCVKVDGRAAVVPALDQPDATLSTDSLTFMLLACGRIDPEAAIAEGKVRWSGDDELGARAARNLRFTM